MRLLVSVRNAAEARLAVLGGAEIVDLKEPSAGPLGMVSKDQWVCILQAIRASAGSPLDVSVALGEVTDWEHSCECFDFPDFPATAELRFNYAKLGLSGLGNDSHWPQRWLAIRNRLQTQQLQNVGWIAVAYADFQRADAPPPIEVIEMAIHSHCQGVLFDTWDKQAGTLWDALSESDLRQGIDLARRAGLLVALAGRLQLQAIPRVLNLQADIMAVRSAACAETNRNGSICQDSVARLKHMLATGATSLKASWLPPAP